MINVELDIYFILKLIFYTISGNINENSYNYII